MIKYDPQKILISIHIPKCAGSSIVRILETWFRGKCLRHYHDEKKDKPPKKHRLYSGLLKNKMRPGLCIHGHFNNNRSNGVRDYYPEANQFITIVRDPFDLHISNYFYVKSLDQVQKGSAYRSGKQHPIVENGWNLEDYLKRVKKSYVCSFLPPELTIENYQQVLQTQFLYVGISEQLQKSVDILAKKLGFNTVKVSQSNVSQWNEKIPKGARKEFEENNYLETVIYKYAKKNWGNSQ